VSIAQRDAENVRRGKQIERRSINIIRNITKINGKEEKKQ
jgi:hypothetical protein